MLLLHIAHLAKASIVVCISLLTSIMMDQKTKLTQEELLLSFVRESQEDQSVINNVLGGKCSWWSLALRPYYETETEHAAL